MGKHLRDPSASDYSNSRDYIRIIKIISSLMPISQPMKTPLGTCERLVYSLERRSLSLMARTTAFTTNHPHKKYSNSS